jgi:biotin carboxylase
MSSPQLAQQAAQVLAAALASLRHADMHALPSAPAAKVTRTVLVVGRGLYALQLCRLHDQSGAQVLLATTASLDYARASLAVARSFVLPKPETDLAAFSDALQRIILEHDVDLVVPAAEEALFVSYLEPGFRLAGSLNRPTLVLTSPFSVLERLHDKHEFQQLCVRAGLRSPSTTRVTSPAQALQALRTLAKAVVKPIFTRGGRAMLVVAGKSDPGSEASVASLGISPSRPHVVQEFVEGLEFSSYSVVASGVVVAHVCYSCAFPVKGFSTVRTTTRKPAILDWVSRFVASLGPHGGFSGQLGFDFIETKDGHIFPLECNPRATNGVSFFACDARLGARLAAAQCSAAAAHAGSLGLAAAVPQTEPPESPPKTPSTKPPLSPLSAKKGLASPSRVFSASPGPSSQHEPVEPAPLTSVATFLPALSLLGRTPGILSALRQAQGDIEWLRDPFPLFMALFKSLHLAATSLRPLMRGQRFADLAANATERELVKFDIKLADLEPDAEPPPPPTLQQSPDLLGAGLGVVDLTEARVLVTGATGFLGSHIVKTLLQRGCTNIVATGRSKANFLALGIDDVVDFAQCDLSDRSAVRKLVENVRVADALMPMLAPIRH